MKFDLNKGKIISKFYVLGFPIYIRKRISNDQFTFPSHVNSFNEIELATIIKYYKQENQIVLNTNKRDDLLIKFLSISVFNLLLNNKIQLYHYIDKHWFVLPFLSIKKHGYTFDFINDSLVDEKISTEILQAIKQNYDNRNKRSYLTKVISDIFDCHLINGKEYRSPSNEIISDYINIVIRNDKRFKVTPVKKSYFHELFFVISTEEKLKRELINGVNIVDNKLIKYYKMNIEFREFWIKFHSVIKSEIYKRQPRENSSS